MSTPFDYVGNCGLITSAAQMIFSRRYDASPAQVTALGFSGNCTLGPSSIIRRYGTIRILSLILDAGLLRFTRACDMQVHMMQQTVLHSHETRCHNGRAGRLYTSSRVVFMEGRATCRTTCVSQIVPLT